MTIPTSKNSKPKTKFSSLNKWGAIVCTIIATIFLFVGVSQLASGPSKIEPLRSDFSNLASADAASVKLDNVANIGIELSSKSRRSTTTYYYFLASVENQKIIIETTSKNDIKYGAEINVSDNISSKTTENLSNIKTLAQENIADKTLKLSSDEVQNIKIVKHFTDSDKFFGDYWAWIIFVIFAIIAVANFVKHNRNRQIAELEEADESSIEADNSQNLSTTKSVASEWGINSEHFLNKKNHTQNQDPIALRQEAPTSIVVYIFLAVFLGVFGVHQFYNRKIVLGLLHILWLPLIILPLIFIQFENAIGIFYVIGLFAAPISMIAAWIQAILRLFKKN